MRARGRSSFESKAARLRRRAHRHSLTGDRQHRRPKCLDRVLAALKWETKNPQQLADELFVARVTIVQILAQLLAERRVFRKFWHNTKTNRPDYLYSSVSFPPRGQLVVLDATEIAKREMARRLLGDWDCARVR